MHTLCSYNKAVTILPYFFLAVCCTFFSVTYLVANSVKTLKAPRYGGVHDRYCTVVKSLYIGFLVYI